ncbi:hypothetical protein C7M61_000625 [Candidozyma pseudohaemuli]|uniref:rRNA-processing protein FYV7 n=1 Tax=Candidozyma pseudohaemuli TaxID=418784 RepID=A0A2P7YYA9_9ASCO|nr:hypothetical protein C7M61_000625 [[Candida] pseudohaemulonii]PSK40958.1 hypothetical protein C7M61_000625 [[Candida] pseudohaemulonii]
MAGSQDRRKPFQGKKFHKDLREYKNQEIKRSLVHRARLRKQYFKLLEEEGEVPSHEKGDNKDQKDDVSDQSKSDESDNDAQHSKVKQKASLPPQQAPPKVTTQRKPLNFQERAKLAKERKEQQREDKLQRVKDRRRAIEQKQMEREKKKESLSRRTKSGQPVMGPKINDLLDKIRNNQ